MTQRPTYEELDSIKKLLNFAPYGVYLIDLSGKIVAVNQRGAEHLGKNLNDAVGCLLREFFPPDVSENRRLKGIEAVQSKQPVTFEDQVKGRSFRNTISPIFDSEGKVTHLAIYGVDITQYKRALEALQESEERFRKIFEEGPLGMAILTTEDMFIRANNRLCQMLGYSEEEMIRFTFYDITHPDTIEKDRQLAKKLLGGKVPRIKIEKRYLKKSGETLWVHVTASFIRDHRGNPLYKMTMIEDITNRKQAEAALRESEEKYRLLFENAGDAVFVAQDNVVKFPNPMTEELTGYSSDELRDIPFVNLIHPDDRDMVLERHLDRLKGERPTSTYAFRIISREKKEIWVELNTVLIHWEGRPATLNFIRDITPQKKMEAQLLQAQKMEAIGTLAGGIAHDFNNLLMGIQGRTSLMMTDLDASDASVDHLKGIEEYIRSASELTKQLLGLARGGKYQVKPTNINALLKSSSEMFGRTKKEITVHTKYQEDLWSVEVDQRQMEQVLLNLYVNAWQAMPGGGEIYLETKNVRLDAENVDPYRIDPGKYVKISVTDTGTGMDKEVQERVFDPFFTTKELGRGTGLGLASAYGIVNNHGGMIDVASEEGYGATFNIYLPASEREVEQPKALPSEILEGDEKILLVDDEALILDVGRQMLEKLGYEVSVAANGQEAIELYESHKEKIDLVILDLVMPGMSGRETYERLVEIDPQVKVLLSSGYSINDEAKEILDRGCNGFIQKPFDLKEVSRKLREILENPASLF